MSFRVKEKITVRTKDETVTIPTDTIIGIELATDQGTNVTWLSAENEIITTLTEESFLRVISYFAIED